MGSTERATHRGCGGEVWIRYREVAAYPCLVTGAGTPEADLGRDESHREIWGSDGHGLWCSGCKRGLSYTDVEQVPEH